MIKLLIFIGLFLSVDVIGGDINNIIADDLLITQQKLHTNKDRKERKQLKLLIKIIKLAIPICETESNCKNVINEDTKDYGIFQANVATINRILKEVPNKLDYFMFDIYTQYVVYKLVMLEKYRLYSKKHPSDWICTYNSAIPKFRKAYCKKLRKNISK